MYMYLSPIQKTSKFNRSEPEWVHWTETGRSGNTDRDLKSEKQTDAAGNSEEVRISSNISVINNQELFQSAETLENCTHLWMIGFEGRS